MDDVVAVSVVVGAVDAPEARVSAEAGPGPERSEASGRTAASVAARPPKTGSPMSRTATSPAPPTPTTSTSSRCGSPAAPAYA